MAVPLKTYTNFLTLIRAKLGAEAIFANYETQLLQLFNDRIQLVWKDEEWIGTTITEKRRLGENLLAAQNDFSTTWTATNVTISTDTTETADPDFNATALADKILETTANAEHKLAQTVTQTSKLTRFYVYVKGGLTRTFLRLSTDGTDAPSAYFDFTAGAGVVGTTANVESADIFDADNDWFRCQIDHKAPYPGTSYQINLASADGTVSYTGSTANGAYLFGARVYDLTTAGQVLPYMETDLTTMGMVYNVWRNDPFITTYPTRHAFRLNTTGAQLAGPTNVEAYVKYAQRVPTYTSSSADIPETLFHYATQGVYSDILMSEGREDAVLAERKAEAMKLDALGSFYKQDQTPDTNFQVYDVAQ